VKYEELKARYVAGDALTKLAAESGCCPKSMRRKLLADGVEIRGRHSARSPLQERIIRRISAGDTNTQIKRALGCNANSIWLARRKVAK